MLSNRDAHSFVGSIPAVLFIASIATLVQSYVLVKLFFLTLFLMTAVISIALGRRALVFHSRLVFFYLWIGAGGMAWAVVGLLHSGNYVQGVLEALRLYVIWSIAFLLLFSVIRSKPSLGVMHNSLVVAGILISLINFIGVADQLGGWELVPESVRSELELYVGLRDGYIRINSVNIGALFLITPYLLSLQCRADAGRANSALTKLALLLCLITVAISGRRALWLIVALTPAMILLLSGLTGSYGLIKVGVRRFLIVCTAGTGLALGALAILPNVADDSGYIGHLKRAFSSDDERPIQATYLIDGFRESPLLGSGFGAYAGYLRNHERPWTYELTYHRMLFNHGIVGMACLGGLFLLYFYYATTLLKRFRSHAAVPFGLLLACSSLLLGAATNPYLGSFDFVFFVGLLPYLATFRHGFDEPSQFAEHQGSEMSGRHEGMTSTAGG